MSAEFSELANHFPEPFRLLIRDTAASTNDELRLLGEQGAPDGLTLLALNQTAGRGRRGAAWYYPPGEALAFSILLRPSEPKSLWPRLALAAGVALAEAAESFGASAGIKWPNDVWIAGRKVAGILVEAGDDFAIVGIGINVTNQKFPPDLENIATSLSLENGWKISRSEALKAIIQRFAIRRSQISSNFDALLDSVRERCVLTDHLVSLSTSHGPKFGTAAGIGTGGELLLKTNVGIEAFIQADSVRIIDNSSI